MILKINWSTVRYSKVWTKMKLYLLVAELLVLKLCSANESCIPTKPFPNTFWDILEYDDKTQQLFVNFTLLSPSVRDCMDKQKSGRKYKFELVTRRDNKVDWACNRLAQHMDIERPAIYFNSSIHGEAFQYIQGQYFLRLKDCSGSSCHSVNEECRDDNIFKDTCVCSTTKHYPQSGTKKELQCAREKSTSLETNTIKQQRFQCESSGLEACNFSFVATIPMCVKIQEYSRVDAKLVKIPFEKEEKNITFQDLESAFKSEVIQISFHESKASSNGSYTTGLVKYNAEVEANSSYVLVIHLLTPHCYRRHSKNCYFVLKAAACHPQSCPVQATPHWEKPMIIGATSGLVFALSLMVAIVVWCKKPDRYQRSDSLLPNDPPPQPPQLNKKQEIVLVHFPDKEIFRQLNNKFREWLSSLSTVSEVIDVNDDKYGEGKDGIIRNPEGWVANTLGDEDKRIVLVTSQLAYECLTSLRKGTPPPKFPNPLDDLLVHMLRFLDSEMFKGNYSRLSCVRYSQIGICHDHFGARAINIVPGTEYLLPDHLDELAGWISSDQLTTDTLAKRQNFISAIEEYQQSEFRNICVYTKI